MSLAQNTKIRTRSELITCNSAKIAPLLHIRVPESPERVRQSEFPNIPRIPQQRGAVEVFLTMLGNTSSSKLQQQQQQAPWERPGTCSFALLSFALCLAWTLLVCLGASTPVPAEEKTPCTADHSCDYSLHRVRLFCLLPARTVNDSFRHAPTSAFLARTITP